MPKLPTSSTGFSRPFLLPDRKHRISRYFFVDYENVHEPGMEGLSKLKSDDLVIVYYSKNVNTMTFDLHNEIVNAKANVELIRVTVGSKNALDFQLSSNLGYYINYNIVAGNKKCRYYIISNDNGYTVLSSFWEQFGAEVSVATSIRSICDPVDTSPFLPTIKTLSLTEAEEHTVVGCIRAGMYGSALHDALQRDVKPPERATEIYHALRSVIDSGNNSKPKLRARAANKKQA